jgi:hypothetical protein
MVILEEILIADGEQWTPKRSEHRQLVVRPLDRHQRGPERFDLFAIVERLAADEQMPQAARLERLDIRTRDVFAVADEAPEQNADVTRFDRTPPAGRTALGDRPPALSDQPVDVGANGVGQ